MLEVEYTQEISALLCFLQSILPMFIRAILTGSSSGEVGWGGGGGGGVGVGVGVGVGGKFGIPLQGRLRPSNNQNLIGSTAITLGERQNRRNVEDNIFKRIFLNGNCCVFIEISLRFVPKGPINNIPAFVQMMAWHRSGDKPLSESMIT